MIHAKTVKEQFPQYLGLDLSRDMQSGRLTGSEVKASWQAALQRGRRYDALELAYLMQDMTLQLEKHMELEYMLASLGEFIFRTAQKIRSCQSRAAAIPHVLLLGQSTTQSPYRREQSCLC